MKDDNKNRPLYMISVAAELAGVHPQTLRIYEAKGIIKPQRTAGNTRMYSQNDIERLELVSQLTDEGINLAGVIRILDMKQRLDERDEQIEQMRAELASAKDRVHELELRETISSLVRAQSGKHLARLGEGTTRNEDDQFSTDDAEDGIGGAL